MDRLDLKVIDYCGPVCETGRHWPPHPGQTCEEVDAWIVLRDEIFSELARAAWERFERSYRNATLAGTVFAAALEEPLPEPPDHSAVQRALDILQPHLAWQPNYRP